MKAYDSVLSLLISLLSGEATRKGFYLYDIRRKASPDPEMTKYIEKSRSIASVTPDPQVSLSLSLICALADTFWTDLYNVDYFSFPRTHILPCRKLVRSL